VKIAQAYSNESAGPTILKPLQRVTSLLKYKGFRSKPIVFSGADILVSIRPTCPGTGFKAYLGMA
jgi:hypothetical protein